MKSCRRSPQALAEFGAGVADGMNAAHNNATAYPAPNSLEGRQTGLVNSDILTGSGTARLASCCRGRHFGARG
jgi:flagellar hook-associated protein 1 FlgK